MEFGYKGYRGVITEVYGGPWDPDRREFVKMNEPRPVHVVHRVKYYGKVVGIRDVVTFVGMDSMEDAEAAFRDSVDDYIEFCAERGEEPERPKP